MVRPKNVIARAVIAVALLAGTVTGCRREPPKLHELSGLEALKAQFNADAGKPRVVLLLSPT